ncbi:MAG: putative porin [Verrucomicrobiota bacterium]
MTKTILTTLALAGALTFGSATVASAQDSGALLDALVRKKVLSSQEAEDVRADLIRESAASNAGKLQLSNSITSLKLSGDVRLRYQYDNKDPQVKTALAASNYLFSPNDTTTINSAYTSYPYSNATGTKFSANPWVYDSKGYYTTTANVYDSKGNLVYAKGDALRDSSGKQIRGVVNPTTTNVGNPANGVQRNRERIRLRLNGDFTLAGGFFGGVQLQTTQNSDSANQTFGDSGSATNPGASASGFSNYSIYLSRAFVGWGNDWLTLVGGKQPNPFYTTDMVWDPDINPSGFVEKVDIMKLFTGGISETLGTTADGKQVSSVSTVRSESPFDLSLVAGQFVFSDNNEDFFGSGYKTDVWLFNTQLIGSYKLNSNVKFTLAPGYMTYTSGNVTDTTGSLNETQFVTTKAGTVVLTNYQYSANQKDSVQVAQPATRYLSIITAPGDVSFKLCGQKVKLLWDFAYNTAGKDRVEQLYGLQDIQIPSTYDANGNVTQYKNKHGAVTSSTKVSATRVSGHSSQDDIAWLAGVQIGENKKKGDWSVMSNFRQTGLGAVDPNLNDSDFALGQLNMQGIKSGVAYNFTDFCVGAITYYNAWNLRKDLIGGQASSGNSIANMNGVSILQVDLNVKF